MKSTRVSIGAIRRRQIVDAAWAVIAEQGLPSLSLSEIEKKIGMSRGQLTYYFKSKEEILLAVFDRLLERCQERGSPEPHPLEGADWEELLGLVLRKVLLEPEPRFQALHDTFLSQVSYRDDFKERLARLYASWRGLLADNLTRALKKRPPARKIAPRTFAILAQSLISGLAVQAAVDPSVGKPELIEMCLDLLRSYLWAGNPPGQTRVSPKGRNGKGDGRRGADARGKANAKQGASAKRGAKADSNGKAARGPRKR